MPFRPRRASAAAVLGLALGCLASACSSSPPVTSSAPAASPPSATSPSSSTSNSTVALSTELDGEPPGAAGCRPASPVASAGLPEVRGTAGTAQLYGLLFLEQPLPVRVGDELKVVWRMTGTGPLAATATAPDGSAAPLAWGPEPHGGSSYDRPGDEWGVGYRFTQPGCWRLSFTRADSAGDVWLQVASLDTGAPGPSLRCADAIDALDAPPPGYTTVLDALALPASRSLEAAPSGASAPVPVLFAKAGLLVRRGAVADLLLGDPAGRHVQLGWGSPAVPATHLHVPRCDGAGLPGEGQWLAFAGGFWVDAPTCASVVVAAGGAQRSLPIGVGTSCSS